MFLIQYYTQVEHVQVQVQEQVQPAAYNKSYDKSSELILSTQIIFMLPPFHTYSTIYIYIYISSIFCNMCRVIVILSYMLVKDILSFRYNKFIIYYARGIKQKKTLKITQMEIDMIDLIKAHLQNILMFVMLN